MQGAGLQLLAEAPGAGQDREQSCWLLQCLHCTGPINQMGRCSKLLTVRLNGFLTGIMPMPWTLAASHSFPGALNKSFFPALFVMWVNKAPTPGQRDGEGSTEHPCCTPPSAKRGRDQGELLQTNMGGELWSPSPSRIAKDLVASTGLLQLAAVAGSPATNHTS